MFVCMFSCAEQDIYHPLSEGMTYITALFYRKWNSTDANVLSGPVEGTHFQNVLKMIHRTFRPAHKERGESARKREERGGEHTPTHAHTIHFQTPYKNARAHAGTQVYICRVWQVHRLA